MASKRQIKKAIMNACGDIAGECIFAESAFGEGKIAVKQCEKELSEYFRTEVENIAKRMNALMPSNKK